MSTDSLSKTNHAFYERTTSKFVSSILLGIGVCGMLAMLTLSGTIASNEDEIQGFYAPIVGIGAVDSNDDHAIDASDSIKSGMGFATFFWVLTFICTLSAAVYYSPLICGSAREKLAIMKGAGMLEGDDSSSVSSSQV